MRALLSLAAVMVIAALYAWRRAQTAWAPVLVVGCFMLAAWAAGLIP